MPTPYMNGWYFFLILVFFLLFFSCFVSFLVLVSTALNVLYALCTHVYTRIVLYFITINSVGSSFSLSFLVVAVVVVLINVVCNFCALLLQTCLVTLTYNKVYTFKVHDR